MFKKILIFSFVLLFFSCNSKIKKPNDLLDRNTFKALITKIYIYKQASSISMRDNTSQEDISLAILKQNHISPEQFKHSLEYYMVEGDAYNKILTEIKDSLKQVLPKDKQPQPLIEDLPLEDSLR